MKTQRSRVKHYEDIKHKRHREFDCSSWSLSRQVAFHTDTAYACHSMVCFCSLILYSVYNTLFTIHCCILISTTSLSSLHCLAQFVLSSLVHLTFRYLCWQVKHCSSKQQFSSGPGPRKLVLAIYIHMQFMFRSCECLLQLANINPFFPRPLCWILVYTSTTLSVWG